jgi:hypothetical protein
MAVQLNSIVSPCLTSLGAADILMSLSAAELLPARDMPKINTIKTLAIYIPPEMKNTQAGSVRRGSA